MPVSALGPIAPGLRGAGTGAAAGHSAPLAVLLEQVADAVQAVREGRSLNDFLPRVPAALRPGTQALAFHALRWLGSATEVRARLASKAPPPAVDALLVTAIALLWPGEPAPYAEHTLVDQAVEAVRRRAPASAGFVNAVLRRFVREREALVEAVRRTPAGAWNHPPWWIERLRQDWPALWQPLLAAANQRPPMTLRVNARRGTGAAYVQRLAAAGRAATLLDGPEFGGPATSATVVLAEPCPVLALPGFAEGEVSVQDAAAQRAARLLIGHGAPHTPGTSGGPPEGRGPAWERPGVGPTGDLPPNARVLDACAAPGGKTAHLLELATLDLLAIDSDPLRLARVQETLNRLQLGTPVPGQPGPASRVELKCADARQPRTWWDGRPFDAILLDAPCTASGIVRRHPDVRWLRRPEDIGALVRIQADLLDALWPLLAPGGRLLYATCSSFKAEGQAQIDAFLQRVGVAGATVEPQSPGHLHPLPDNPVHGSAGSAPGPVPNVHAVQDGFFYASIRKA